MVERLESAAIIVGAILMEYPKLSIEQMIVKQTLDEGYRFPRFDIFCGSHPIAIASR
jgi:hypothetical protein